MELTDWILFAGSIALIFNAISVDRTYKSIDNLRNRIKALEEKEN